MSSTIPIQWFTSNGNYYTPLSWEYNQPVINDGIKNIVASTGTSVVFGDLGLRICSFEYTTSLDSIKDQPFVESGKAMYAILKEDNIGAPILETEYYNSVSSSIYLPNQTTEPLANQQNNVFETYGEGITLTPHSDGNHRILLSWVWSIDVSEESAAFKLCRSVDGGPKEDVRVVKYESKETGGSGEVVNVIEAGSIVGSTQSGTDTRIPQILMLDMELSKSELFRP